MTKQHWWHNSRGEWYVVVQFILMASAVAGPLRDAVATWTTMSLWNYLGIPVTIVGLFITLRGWRSLGRNMSPFPKPLEHSEFVQGGLYSVVRHPMYVGLIITFLGWSLLWYSLISLESALLLFLLFDNKASREERWLESKFSEYAEYKKRTKKLIPWMY